MRLWIKELEFFMGIVFTIKAFVMTTVTSAQWLTFFVLSMLGVVLLFAGLFGIIAWTIAKVIIAMEVKRAELLKKMVEKR